MQNVFSANAVLWILSLYNMLFDITGSTIHLIKDVLNAVKNVFRPKYYVLFEGSSAAYNVNLVAPYASGSAQAKWVFSPDDSSFFQWNRTIYGSIHNSSLQSHFLPILSLEIVRKEDNYVQYDLTDYLENFKVRIEGNSDTIYPSVSDILAVWTTSSGIIPDAKTFKATIFTQNAVSMDIELTDMRPVNQLEDSIVEAETGLGKVDSESDVSVSSSSSTAPEEGDEAGSSTKED